MKTKIIYISGNEVFEMADIRAAFDEVRATLGLDSDTVLFGVPVDKDNAIDATNTKEADVIPAIDNISATNNEQISADNIVTPDVQPDDEIVPVVQKVKKNATKRKRIADAPQTTEPETQIDAYVCENNVTTEPIPEQESEPAEKVIPILSVLASKTTETTDNNTASITESDTASHDTEKTDAKTDDADKIDDTETSVDVTTVSIEDMVSDDTPPVVAHEKTLEELLESMTPLMEDTEPIVTTDITDIDIDEPEENIVSDTFGNTPGDATLEQLATEFAQNEDKIVTTKKSASQGKIGKLKNILPFKKARRDDNGLMGDLFGWAGIAANDEDFAIPGFFTTAAKK